MHVCVLLLVPGKVKTITDGTVQYFHLLIFPFGYISEHCFVNMYFKVYLIFKVSIFLPGNTNKHKNLGSTLKPKTYILFSPLTFKVIF